MLASYSWPTRGVTYLTGGTFGCRTTGMPQWQKVGAGEGKRLGRTMTQGKDGALLVMQPPLPSWVILRAPIHLIHSHCENFMMTWVGNHTSSLVRHPYNLGLSAILAAEYPVPRHSGISGWAFQAIVLMTSEVHMHYLQISGVKLDRPFLDQTQ